MAIENESVAKTDLFRAIVESATEYYKLMITIASAFLGGSLLFVEKLSPSANPLKSHVILLGCGWLFLVVSIILILVVQRSNLKSGKLVMEGKMEEAAKIDCHTGCESTWALVALALGIVLIMLYGLLNLLRIAT
jgi:hypothetical protein